MFRRREFGARSLLLVRLQFDKGPQITIETGTQNWAIAWLSLLQADFTASVFGQESQGLSGNDFALQQDALLALN